jgi:PAS domain S-box-containing protein
MMSTIPMIGQPLHTDNHIEGRLEFETLISDTSATLLAAPLEEVDLAVERALERVRSFFEADRSLLLSVSADQQVARVRLGAYADGVSRVPPDVNLAEMFSWARQKLLVERLPVRVERLAELPPEADSDRASARSLEIRSSLALPIETGAQVRHLIVIQTVHRERDWPDALVARLRVLGGLLVVALERKEMFAQIRETEARVSVAADSAEAGLWVLDCGTGVFWASERARAIFGYSPDEVITVERFAASVHPDDKRLLRNVLDRSQHGRDPLNVECRILLGDGRVRWIASRGRPQLKPTGEPERLTGASIDITERRHADEELADLSRRLIRAHEDERALLARELHDDVTQRLAVLAIDAGRAEIAEAGGPQAEKMRAIREGLVHLSEDIHSLAYQLHPSVLDELGLAEALRTACERFGRQGHVALTVDLDPVPADLRRDVALCLFRVAQEALRNVSRHARARAASVALRRTDGGMRLAVRDDGVGFDAASPGTRRSLGLASMRERVRLVNGTLEIESAPGRGTAIVAWVPTGGGAP